MSKKRKHVTALPFYKIEADKLLMDLITIDSTTGAPEGRPTLRILYDSITKVIVGSSVQIKSLVIDNGRELEAAGLEKLYIRLAIALIRHPHYKPQFKGVVERHFQKQNRAFNLNFLNSSNNQTNQSPLAIKKRGK